MLADSGEGTHEGSSPLYRQPRQSPDRLYKDPTDNTKPPNDYTKPLNIRQKPKILDKYPKYLTRVATNINLTGNIKYPICKTSMINEKGIIINEMVLIMTL